jgi:hypothetical protein
MSTPKVIAAKSLPLRIGEWTTQWKGTIPRHTTPDGPEPIAIADAHASLVLDSWVYVIAQRATDTTHGEVASELYVDGTGRIWVTEGDHHLPIPDRGRSVAGHASHTVQLPVLDAKRNALWLWLVLSPFRLPQPAVMKLTELAGEIAKHVPPLWDWRKGRGLPGVVQSRDGWSLQETPLWLTVPPGLPDAGTHRRVALGIDPFTIAKLRSNRYVKAYAKYKNAYEPEDPKTGSDFQRIALGRLIYQTIFTNDAAADKYREHVNISALNDAIAEDDKRRNALIRASEEAAFALVEVMRSTLFKLWVQASISDEGLDGSEPSRPLQILYEVLGRCTRSLNGSTAGRALLQYWATTARDHPDFFINHVILPTKDPSVPRFKAFRWGSKAIAGVLAQYLAHHVTALRGKIIAPVAKDFEDLLIEALVRLTGKAGKATPVDFTIEAQLNLKRVVKRVYLKYHVGGTKVTTIDMPFLGPGESRWIGAWIDAGKLKEFGVGAKFEDAKFLGSLLLDTINICLGLAAWRDADPGMSTYFAAGSVTAHTFNLVAALSDEYIKEVLKDDALRIGRGYILRVRAVGAGVFAVKNARDALKAYEKGDRDAALLLGIAAAGEAAAGFGYFVSTVATASAAGPWIAVVGTLVAAGAYIAAEMFTDDELATFLSHSEWGSRPYAEASLQPKWAASAVGTWKDDYIEQRRLLLKLLTKFSVRWASHGISAMGVEITLAVVTPQSVLRVKFVARRDGEDVSDDLVFRDGALPQRFPGTVVARPGDTLRRGEPPDFIAVVDFQWHPDEQPERVVFTLRAGGVDQPDGEVSSLE